MTGKVKLKEVTLCCVDTRSPSLALRAMKLCMANIDFGECIFWGPKWYDPTPDLSNCDAVTYIGIEDLSNIHSYSEFMLRGLPSHIGTSHALIVQWDGYITNANLWRDDFLSYDYIGAPWYIRHCPAQVGNGGFSLRSKRLLEAVAGLTADYTTPEDETICKTFRNTLETNHRMQFAPVGVAEDFSCEYGKWRDAFGFHGVHNFANLMTDEELLSLTQQFPIDILLSKHTRNLIKCLMQQGRTSTALALIRERIKNSGWSLDHSMLIVRALALGAFR